MDELAGTSSAPEDSGAGRRWISAILVVLALVALAWILRASGASENEFEPPVPSIAAAADLPADLRVEWEGQLARERERLQVLDRQASAREAGLSAGATMSPAQVQAIIQQIEGLEETIRAPQSTRDDLAQAASDIRGLWRDRMLGFESFLRTSPRADGPQLPRFQSLLCSEAAGTLAANQYRQEYEAVARHFAKLQVREQVAWEAELQGRAERLRRILALRYQALRRLQDLGALPALADLGRFAQDAFLEVSSYPARRGGLVRLRMLELRHQAGGGLPLGLRVGHEVGLVLLGLAIAVVPVVLAARGSRRRRRHPQAWAGVFVAAVAARWVLTDSLGDALRPALSLVQYYAAWRLYLDMVETTLGPAISWILGDASPAWPEAGTRALRRLGLVFAFRAVLLRLTLAVAGPGVLLLALQPLANLIVVVVLWAGAWSWRADLGILLDRLAPRALGPALADLCTSPRTAWLVAPFAALTAGGLILLNLTVGYLSRFETGKRLSAGVLRRWMEVSGSEPASSGKPPAGYREAFRAATSDPVEAWKASDPGFLPAVFARVDHWHEGHPGEPYLAVHGPLGSGRGTLAELLKKRYSDRLPVVELRLPDHITTAAELTRAMAAAFGLPPQTGAEDLARVISSRPPTLILIPRANRLFLATVGGFEAFRAMQLLVRRCREQVFWVFLLSTPGLAYLQAISAGDAGVTQTARIPAWSDEALRDMILQHHAATGRALRFADSVRRAAQATPGCTPDSHYFQILWEQSAGNPSVAQELWLAGAGEDPDGALRVGLPPRNPAGLLAAMPSVVSFVLATVVRHESLTVRQASLALGLPERRVFLACEQCLEAGVLEVLDAGQLRIPYLWQVDVRRFLRERNLLDGA